MSDHNNDLDRYEEYEAQFDPGLSDRNANRTRKRHRRLDKGGPAGARSDRQARRQRKPLVAPRPKKAQDEVVSEIADVDGLESGFKTTYQPSKYESGWLMSALETLSDQQFITDVLALVRGGKEASVYCCEAHESTGEDLLAAKVYRPRMFRQLRNDGMYRQGREIIMGDGTRLNDTDDREMRAIAKNTAYGQKVRHTSWLMHEYISLNKLYQAGAAVPRPWAIGDNTILMAYIGDETTAAPTFNTIRLEPDEVEPLFQEVLRNIELLLQHNLIHGDLSAYNILYWEGEITMIDFPQVADVRSNPDAHFILQRDIVRICEYFAQQGYRRDPISLAGELWYRYGFGDPLSGE